MTLEERQKLTDEFFDTCKETLSCKGKDYNPDEAFKELKETAEDMGVEPVKVLWILVRKHLSAVKAFVQNGKVESEPIKMRLVDVANYMALIYALTKEKE